MHGADHRVRRAANRTTSEEDMLERGEVYQLRRACSTTLVARFRQASPWAGPTPYAILVGHLSTVSTTDTFDFCEVSRLA